MKHEGKKVRIISENDNYSEFKDSILTIKYVYRDERENPFYDMCLYPQKLFEFEDVNGKEVPFALYEYEVEFISGR